jgi:soluble lytic murein transglycosylase-like protein
MHAFPRAIFLGLAALAAVEASAGELAASGRSPYRLKLDDVDALRLTRPALHGDSLHLRSRLSDRPYASQIQRAARSAAIDPALVHAVIAVESGYDASARSRKGAIGLMQVMPGTAQRYGVLENLRSAEVNLSVGTRYLSDLLTMFGGRLDLALAAYNAGERTVLARGMRVPPYRETRRYVATVSKIYRAARGRATPTSDSGQARYLRGTRLAPSAERMNRVD